MNGLQRLSIWACCLAALACAFDDGAATNETDESSGLGTRILASTPSEDNDSEACYRFCVDIVNANWQNCNIQAYQRNDQCQSSVSYWRDECERPYWLYCDTPDSYWWCPGRLQLCEARASQISWDCENAMYAELERCRSDADNRAEECRNNCYQ